ncbi:MAG: hypothetical protein KHX55_01655 [Proteobacteria bacterium]|nr:hypothetical protein [Pseudomonadota bacterium]
MQKLNGVVVTCKFIIFFAFLMFMAISPTATILMHGLVPYDFSFFLFDVSIVVFCIILPLGEKKYKWIQRSKIPGKDDIHEKFFVLELFMSVVVNWIHWDMTKEVLKAMLGKEMFD